MRGRPKRDYDTENEVAWENVQAQIRDIPIEDDLRAMMEDPGAPLGAHKTSDRQTGGSPAKMPRRRSKSPSMRLPGPNACTSGGPVEVRSL